MRPTIVVGLGGSNGWFALAWAIEHAMFAGRPLDGLLRAADTAALLVVGQSSHRTPAQASLGTVADGVVDAADGPVAVVKEVRR